jgi:hypothetical protein
MSIGGTKYLLSRVQVKEYVLAGKLPAMRCRELTVFFS